MMYAWGQFVDHDLDLEGQGGAAISIKVPNGDPNLADGSEIPLTRAIIDPATGNATRSRDRGQHDHRLDGRFQIYGSDAATAANLRTADGHMKTSVGNNLPIVTGTVRTGSGGHVRCRRCARAGKSRSDRAAGPVRSRAQLSGRSAAPAASELDRRSALSKRARHRDGGDRAHHLRRIPSASAWGRRDPALSRLRPYG